MRNGAGNWVRYISGRSHSVLGPRCRTIGLHSATQWVGTEEAESIRMSSSHMRREHRRSDLNMSVGAPAYNRPQSRRSLFRTQIENAITNNFGWVGSVSLRFNRREQAVEGTTSFSGKMAWVRCKAFQIMPVDLLGRYSSIFMCR